MPEQFIALVAIHYTGCHVTVNNRPGNIRGVRIDHHDSIWREIEQPTEQRFTLFQRGLSLLATRDVTQDKKILPFGTFHHDRNCGYIVKVAQPEESTCAACEIFSITLHSKSQHIGNG